jgi:Secretion system C-terminal sorting domain
MLLVFPALTFNQKNYNMQFKKYILSIIMLCNMPALVLAQAHKLLWVKRVTSSDVLTATLAEVTNTGVDKDGNYYGVFESNNSFSGNIDTSFCPYSAIGVAKWACNSDTAIWVKWWYNTAADGYITLINATVDEDGNTYILGQSDYGSVAGVTMFDTTINYTVFSDSSKWGAFIKLDKNGNRVWTHWPGKWTYSGEGGLTNNVIASDFDEQGNLDLLINNAFNFLALNPPHIDSQVKYFHGQILDGYGLHVAKVNMQTGICTSVTKLQIQNAAMDSTLGISGYSQETPRFFISDSNAYFLGFNLGDTIIIGNTIYNYLPINIVGSDNFIVKMKSDGSNYWVRHFRDKINPTTFIPRVLYIGFAKKKNQILINIFSKSDTINSLTFEGFDNRNKLNNYTNSNVNHAGILSLNSNTGVSEGLNILNVAKYGTTDLIVVTKTSLYTCGFVTQGNAYFGSAINPLVDTIVKPTTPTNTAFGYVAKFDLDSANTYRWNSGCQVSNISYWPYNVNEDKYGNVYVSGYSSGAMQDSAGNMVTIASNAFIYKVGDPANQCVCIPPKCILSIISSNGTSVQVKATSTGSVDSLVWLWGDGTQTKYAIQGSNASHTYTSGGNKTICLRTYVACGFADSCFTINALGIANNGLQNILVYPNPASSIITIENPFSNFVSYTMQNQQGQLVIKGELQKGKQNIYINMLQSGIYFLQFVAEDGVKYVQKIIKE